MASVFIDDIAITHKINGERPEVHAGRTGEEASGWDEMRSNARSEAG
jgi:hypothetical protein